MIKEDNLNNIEGNVPIFKALPFGLQHVLAIFIANIAPILLLLNNKEINTDQNLTRTIVQNSLFIAGIGTLIQLFPIWKVGSKLPIYVGISFTYLSVLIYIGTRYGYNVIISSVLIGSIFMIVLSFFTKAIRKIVPSITSSIVVFMLGFSLALSQVKELNLFNKSFYTYKNIIVLLTTIVTYIICTYCFNKKIKNFALLISLIIGYVFSLILGMIDYSVFNQLPIFTYPRIYNFKNIEFSIEAIISVCLIFLVSTTDVFGAIFALDIPDKDEEKSIPNGICGIGVGSLISGIFGATPITPFIGNIGIVNNTKVVNRRALGLGAIILIIASFFPIFGAFAQSIPSTVVYVSMIILFVGIAISGIKMIYACGINKKNILVIAITGIICIALYLLGTYVSSIPNILKIIFTNVIATSFLFSTIIYYLIPGEKILLEKNDK